MKFISDFFDEPIPQESLWMTKYFDTPMRESFLRYFLNFKSSVHFHEHTGFYCTVRYRKKMKSELLRLIDQHSSAKKNGDFEKVSEIEMGNYKLS